MLLGIFEPPALYGPRKIHAMGTDAWPSHSDAQVWGLGFRPNFRQRALAQFGRVRA